MKKTISSEKTKFLKVFKNFIFIILGLIVSFLAFFLGIYKDWFENLPNIEHFNKTSIPSIVISSDGKIIGKFETQNKLTECNHFSNYYLQQVKKEVEQLINNQHNNKLDLYKDGLKIYITIDSRMQKYAEESVKEHLQQIQDFYEIENKKNLTKSNLDKKMENKITLESMYRTERYQNLKKIGLNEEQIIQEFKKIKKIQLLTWNGYKDSLISPWDSIVYHNKIVNCGLLSLETNTGNIKAWIGGIDWNYFQYDHVIQAKRQIGSIFKSFYFASLIKNNNYTPCTDILKNSQSLWKPKHSNDKLSFKGAFAKSFSTSNYLPKEQKDIDNTINLCRDLGISNTLSNDKFLILGSSNVTLSELVAAHNTFSNKGTYIKPCLLLKIVNNQGKILHQTKLIKRNVLTELQANMMIEILKENTKEGTSKGIKSYLNKVEIAGKTGSTNSNSDAWFVGMIPNITTGVWVGWENRVYHFNSGLGQGSKSALPFLGIFINKVQKDKSLNYYFRKKTFFDLQKHPNFICEMEKENVYGGNYGTIEDFKVK